VLSYTSTPSYVLMEYCVVKHRDNFTFYIAFFVIVFTSLTLVSTCRYKIFGAILVSSIHMCV
jgi:hypothetical protein